MSEGYNYNTDIDREKGIMATFMTAREGSCFIDVGAHVGYWSKYMAKRGIKVYSFEPTPETFRRLLSMSLKYPEITAYRIALAEASGTRQMYTYKCTGENSLRFNHPEFLEEIIDVEVKALDDMVFTEPVGLIKIDTEGYENLILVGAVKTIIKYKPRIILEVHRGQRKLEDEEQILFDILHTLGYRVRVYYKKETGQPIMIADYVGVRR